MQLSMFFSDYFEHRIWWWRMRNRFHPEPASPMRSWWPRMPITASPSSFVTLWHSPSSQGSSQRTRETTISELGSFLLTSHVIVIHFKCKVQSKFRWFRKSEVEQTIISWLSGIILQPNTSYLHSHTVWITQTTLPCSPSTCSSFTKTKQT